MTKRQKNERIYVALAFLTAIGQLTWVQMAYNDPSFVSAWTLKELAIEVAISAVFVLTATLVAWKAYLSDPNVVSPHDSPPPTPPVPPTPTNTIETNP